MKKMSTKFRKINKKSVFLRFILSFLIILIIPLTIITMHFSGIFLKRFQDEVLETVDMELVQMLIYSDVLLDKIQSTTVRLSLDESLKKAIHADNLLDFLPVISYMSIVVSSNQELADMILVLDDSDYVITSTTTCKKDLFYKQYFTNPELAEKILKEAYPDQSFIPRFIQNESIGYKTNGISFFSLPIYTDYQERHGNIIFLIRSDVFNEYIGTRLNAYNALTVIFDNNGACVYSSSPIADFNELKEKHENEYIIRSRTSDHSGWHGFAFMNRQMTVFDKVVSISREFELTLLFITVFATIVIMFLSQINYSPIKKLNSKARELIPENERGNEIENISHTIDYLKTENTSLSAKLEESMEAVKNIAIMRLISGEYSSKNEFNEDVTDLDISLSGRYFTVAIIKTGEKNVETAITIKRAFSNLNLIYCHNPFAPSTIVFLLNSDSEIYPDDIFQNILSYIKTNLQINATIGIGSTTDDTEKIPKSYIDANSALDYRFVKGNGCLISYSEAISNTDDLIYPKKEFEKLANALTSMNSDAIDDAIRSIAHVLSTDGIPIYLARNICFDMIHMVSKSSAFTSKGKPEAPFKLTGLETASEIVEMINSWQSTLKRSSIQNPSIQSIQKYLAENCMKCSFSVYDTADHFSMSLPAFSKYYKDNTGMNVIDYTTTLRIEKAKDMLKNTNIPITEIAESVGYYNLSSFTRRFKLNQGISPSEYRNNREKYEEPQA